MIGRLLDRAARWLFPDDAARADEAQERLRHLERYVDDESDHVDRVDADLHDAHARLRNLEAAVTQLGVQTSDERDEIEVVTKAANEVRLQIGDLRADLAKMGANERRYVDEGLTDVRDRITSAIVTAKDDVAAVRDTISSHRTHVDAVTNRVNEAMDRLVAQVTDLSSVMLERVQKLEEGLLGLRSDHNQRMDAIVMRIHAIEGLSEEEAEAVEAKRLRDARVSAEALPGLLANLGGLLTRVAKLEESTSAPWLEPPGKPAKLVERVRALEIEQDDARDAHDRLRQVVQGREGCIAMAGVSLADGLSESDLQAIERGMHIEQPDADGVCTVCGVLREPRASEKLRALEISADELEETATDNATRIAWLEARLAPIDGRVAGDAIAVTATGSVGQRLHSHQRSIEATEATTERLATWIKELEATVFRMVPPDTLRSCHPGRFTLEEAQATLGERAVLLAVRPAKTSDGQEATEFLFRDVVSIANVLLTRLTGLEASIARTNERITATDARTCGVPGLWNGLAARLSKLEQVERAERRARGQATVDRMRAEAGLPPIDPTVGSSRPSSRRTRSRRCRLAAMSKESFLCCDAALPDGTRCPTRHQLAPYEDLPPGWSTVGTTRERPPAPDPLAPYKAVFTKAIEAQVDPEKPEAAEKLRAVMDDLMGVFDQMPRHQCPPERVKGHFCPAHPMPAMVDNVDQDDIWPCTNHGAMVDEGGICLGCGKPFDDDADDMVVNGVPLKVQGRVWFDEVPDLSSAANIRGEANLDDPGDPFDRPTQPYERDGAPVGDLVVAHAARTMNGDSIADSLDTFERENDAEARLESMEDLVAGMTDDGVSESLERLAARVACLIEGRRPLTSDFLTRRRAWLRAARRKRVSRGA